MNRILLTALAAILLVTVGLLGYGFTGTNVSGVLLDAFTNKPIVNANIIIGDKSTTSNKSGKYYLKISHGHKQIKAMAAGYETIESSLDVPFLLPKKTDAIYLRNGIIVGKVLEAYPNRDPLVKAKIIIGKYEIMATSDGTFKIIGIPIGERDLTVQISSSYDYLWLHMILNLGRIN